MICPDCKGEKKIGGFGCPGFRYIELPCHLCNETGEINEATQSRIERGDKVREARLAQGLTLRAFCLKVNLKPSEVSNYERGILSEHEEFLTNYWHEYLHANQGRSDIKSC